MSFPLHACSPQGVLSNGMSIIDGLWGFNVIRFHFFFHALFLFSSLAGKTHVAQGTMEHWLSFACSLPCRPLFRELDGTYTCTWSLFFTSSSPASQFSVHWKSLQSFPSTELWPNSQMVVSALNGEEPVCLLFFSVLAFQRATSSLLSPPAAVTNHLFSAFISH